MLAFERSGRALPGDDRPGTRRRHDRRSGIQLAVELHRPADGVLPMARSPEGLPLGLQLVGRPWGEADLLAVAAWCEDELGFRMGEPAA